MVIKMIFVIHFVMNDLNDSVKKFQFELVIKNDLYVNSQNFSKLFVLGLARL